MLRHASQRLLGSVSRSRCIATSAARFEGETSSTKAFTDKFMDVVPSTMTPPFYPSDYLPKKEAVVGTPEKLTFNFYVPHMDIMKGEQVDLVLVPAVTGDFGVMPGHVPTIAQLRPGVVTVHTEQDKVLSKYFVSSGFALIHENSETDIIAAEAVKLEDLDHEAIRAGLQEYTAKLAAVQAKGDDYETAAAQIGVEVYSAMNSAIGG